MSKRIIIASSALIFVFATAIPVYAQTPEPTQTINQGFFGQIANFFGTLFHHQNEQSGTNMREQGIPMQGVTPGQPAPSGAMGPNPSGQPSFQSIQQYRLTKLVNEGKITQTQEQEILTELTTVQSELTTWAQSQGINSAYVLGVPMVMGTGQQSGTQSTANGQQQGQGQMHPMYYQGGFREGSGSGGPGGQQGGSQAGGQRPPVQPQGQ